jgi:hypothetical protein
MWNSLEIAKLIVQLLVPVSVAFTGLFINNRLKRIDEAQWKGRRIIDKRIEIFERLAPDLNQLFCYMDWVGEWQEITPPEVISMKRRLDKGFYVNRYLIGDSVFDAYETFIGLLFRTNVAAGKDAMIRTSLTSENGDRRKSPHFTWKPEWEAAFDGTASADRKEVRRAYTELMHRFKTSIGL